MICLDLKSLHLWHIILWAFWQLSQVTLVVPSAFCVPEKMPSGPPRLVLTKTPKTPKTPKTRFDSHILGMTRKTLALAAHFGNFSAIWTICGLYRTGIGKKVSKETLPSLHAASIDMQSNYMLVNSILICNADDAWAKEHQKQLGCSPMCTLRLLTQWRGTAKLEQN